MSNFNKLCSALCLTLALVAPSVFADSELDPVNAPTSIIRHFDPATQKVVDYRVDISDATLAPEALEKLSAEERKAKVDALLKSVVKEENKIAEERVEKVASELDETGATDAHYVRWRYRGRSTGYYYGYSYYRYYGQRPVYYQPHWGWNYEYGYYRGGYDCYRPYRFEGGFYTYYRRW